MHDMAGLKTNLATHRKQTVFFMSASMYWFVLALFCLHFHVVNLCGIATHIDIGERASEFCNSKVEGVDIRQLINEHGDAFQAGCPYPDAYYLGLCRNGIFHNVSEDTHWTPFLNVSINYIRKHYPQPWDTATKKLVVFLMGVAQHQVADISWHSLGIPQGFLRSMANINFHGSFGDAHEVGDFGGDVVNLFELDMSYIGTNGKWYVPTQDLMEIHRVYYDESVIGIDDIEYCTRWQYLSRLGEMTGALELVFPLIAASSPFLVDRLNDYFLGGMDDMAAWSARTWGRVSRMLDQGTQICDLPENPIYITCDGEDKLDHKSEPIQKELLQKIRDIKNQYMPTLLRGMHWNDIIVERTERGVEFRPSKRIQKLLADKHIRQKHLSDKHKTGNAEQATFQRHSDTDPAAIYGTRQKYSRLGESLLSADVNNDGYDDLVIGAPGYSSLGNANQGRVYIVYGTAKGLPLTNLILEQSADVILSGPKESGRFGTSLAVVDLNADGLQDLVISAPQVGSHVLNYQGEVYVYFGQHVDRKWEVDVTITCEERYCNLGWALAAGDLNGDGDLDLLIGSPFAQAGGEQRGHVGAIFATPSATSGDILDTSNFDLMHQGEKNYDWFGFSLAVDKDSVFIGAPGHRQCVWSNCSYDSDDAQSVGKTYLFSGNSTSTWLGDQVFGQLGYSVHQGAFAGHVLASGAVTYGSPPDFEFNQEGEVFQSDPCNNSASLVGDRAYSHYGQVIKTVDLDGDGANELIVAAPLRTESLTFTSGAEEGRVFVYRDNGGTPKLSMELTLGENKSRFGYSIATVHSSNKVQLVVSAPHSNTGARLGGRVAIFNF